MHDEDSSLNRPINSTPASPTVPLSADARLETELEQSSDHKLGFRSKKLGENGVMVITLVNIIGWLIMYFLIISLQTTHNKNQAKLFDAKIQNLQSANRKLVKQIEGQGKFSGPQLDLKNNLVVEAHIKRLEAATARIEKQLTKVRIQTKPITDFNLVRQGLRPNLLYGKFEFSFVRSEVAELEHQIRNIGTNAAFVEAPVVRLSLRAISEKTTDDELLLVNKDYSVRAYRPGMFQPGYAAKVSYSIELLNDKLKGEVIHYELEWEAVTDSASVAAAAEILGDRITDTDLMSLSRFTQRLRGTITYKP